MESQDLGSMSELQNHHRLSINGVGMTNEDDADYIESQDNDLCNKAKDAQIAPSIGAANMEQALQILR